MVNTTFPFFRMAGRLSVFLLMALTLWLSACKKDDDNPANNNPGGGGGKYVLLIEQGARTIQLQQSLTYTARLVDQTGNSQPASGSWTSNNTDVATIAAVELLR